MILVFGTVCLDRVYRIPQLPSPGGYSPILGQEVFLGGEAANTAFALRTWGADCVLYGNAMGEDEDARLLRQMLADKSLNNAHLPEGPDRTPVCHVYVTPDGERTMFGIGFGEGSTDYPVEALPFRKGDWFTADPNMGSVARRAAKSAAEAGMMLYLMDFVASSDSFAPGSYWQSSTDWVGFRGNTQKNVAWVQRHVERHGCFTILSDGPNGLVAGSPEHEVRAYPPYPCPKLVDSTGAGDMLRAGMLFGLSQSWPISRCLRFASAAGSLKCRSLGATSDVPSISEIEEHIARHRGVSRFYSQ